MTKISATPESLTRLHRMVEEVCVLLGPAAGGLELWRRRLSELSADDDEPLRVAVAGTVKSGKTTLVNALLGDDLLKRGAGIVTSVVTRVRPGRKLRATIQLKGWEDVNREATDAALFTGYGEPGRAVDLKVRSERSALAAHLAELGEGALGENGHFEKHVVLLSALLDGFDRVEGLMERSGRTFVLDAGRFAEHRDFAGSDALAAYVDDLLLEVPNLDFSGRYEIADCQGYDSPNPRHREKVQEYLMGCHQVVYVVSSRVGLREADLRFVRDIDRMGLLDVTRVVLNADLTEHADAEDLANLRQRVETELRPFGSSFEIVTFSALKALLTALQEKGETLARKDGLLLQLWEEGDTPSTGEYHGFRKKFAKQLEKKGRGASMDAAVSVTLERAAGALRTGVENLLAVTGDQTESLQEGQESLADARQLMERALENFTTAMRGRADAIKADAFARANQAFHPSGGRLAEEVLGRVRLLTPAMGRLDKPDKKRLFIQLSAIYQDLRGAWSRYKVEEVNGLAVEEIRTLWGDASEALEEAAEDAATLLIEAAEGYRALAVELGVELEELDLPEPDTAIGRRTIPLFSAVTNPAAESTADTVLSFARQWSVRLATGWASRLFAKKSEEKGATPDDGLLGQGAAAARVLLEEEARSALLNYCEQVKYQVIGKNLDDLAAAWVESYRETLDALAVDLDRLLERVDASESETQALVPRLETLLEDLSALGE